MTITEKNKEDPSHTLGSAPEGVRMLRMTTEMMIMMIKYLL